MAAIELYSTPLFGDANLRAYYRFNTGALTTDSKDSYTLTNNNTVGEDTGKFGIGADFGDANTNKCFSQASDWGLTSAGSFTISFWIKLNTETPASDGNNIRFWQVDVNDAHRSIPWVDYGYYSTPGYRLIRVYRYGATFDIFDSAQINLGTTTWHLITVTYDGSTVTLYIDGAYSNSVASSGTLATPVTEIASLGCAFDWSMYNSAIFDDFAVFDRALTATEVGNLYNGTWSTTETKTIQARARVKQTETSKTIQTKARVKLSDVTKTLTAKAGVRNTITCSLSARANIAPISARVSQVSLSSPTSGSSQASPVVFTWHIPQTSNGEPVHSQIQVDDTDETFGNLALDKASWVDEGFEYWNDSDWVTYPTSGVSSGYAGNEARLSATVTPGTRYWRVRGRIG